MKIRLAVLKMLIPVASAPLLAQPNEVGKIVQPAHDVFVPTAIREKLAEAADIRVFQTLSKRDSVVVYDTVRDKEGTTGFMDNVPHIALFRGDALLLNIDSGAPGGPVRFHAAAVVPVSHRTSLLAFAFQLGVDGAGTYFVFIDQKADGYGVVAKLEGAQAQVRFFSNSLGRFELWTADGQVNREPDRQCVWCPKYYRTTTYIWKNGAMRRLETIKSRRGYDPETFDDSPFELVK